MNGYKLFGILFVALLFGLIVAKLTGYLHWAWWIIFIPVWAPIVIAVLAAFVAIVGFSGAESRGENPFQ